MAFRMGVAPPPPCPYMGEEISVAPLCDDSASFSRPYNNWAEVMSPSTTSSFAQRFRGGGEEGETWRILLPPTSKNPSPFEEFASRVLGMTRI